MPPKNAADYADEIKAMYPATTEEAMAIVTTPIRYYI